MYNFGSDQCDRAYHIYFVVIQQLLGCLHLSVNGHLGLPIISS